VIAYPDFANCTVLVIGDVMLDRYFWGDVERISPESPVPVVWVNKKTLTFGGTGNGAKNLKGLNCKQVLLDLRGNDSKGVDLVIFFHEATPVELIRSFKPDIIVKGGDYTPEQVVGHEIVEQEGGKVIIVSLIEGVSTTKVIESIKPN
jgi:bifunctional ADP-heptose synthase (sugar kinase/adenylyltransferase)